MRPRRTARRSRTAARPQRRATERNPEPTPFLETLLRDLGYAARAMLRSPGFTGVAVLTLAIGIGATTVVFTLVNALLLRPLPVTEPDRLVTIHEVREGATEATVRPTRVSYPRYVEYRDRATVFAGLAAVGSRQVALRSGSGAETVFSNFVSANFFEVLGVHPQLGQPFTHGDDADFGAHPVAVISHHLWNRHFDADPAAVGRTLHLNGQPLTVIGVAPRGFGGTHVGIQEDIWVPLSMYETLFPTSDIRTRGTLVWLFMVGRLAPDLEVAGAEAALSIASRGVAPENVVTAATTAVRLERLSGIPISGRNAAIGFLALLMATAVLVLLIACTNVGGMMMARATVRRHDLAVRLALGAARERLIRQLVTESVLLFLVGGTVGVLLAGWVARLLPALLPPMPGRIELDLGLDARVLVFALALSVATGVLFGMLPALQASRTDPLPTLKSAGEARGAAGTRLRSAFVVGQISMSLLLLVTAGLFGRALRDTLSSNLGFDPDGVVVARLDLAPHGYDAARGREFFRRLHEATQALPGVEAASLAAMAPLSGSSMTTLIDVPATASGERREHESTHYSTAGAGYFELLRMRITRGRSVVETDAYGAPGVVVVNESLARRHWPDGSAVGRQIVWGGTPLEVVGVVDDGSVQKLGEPSPPFFYLPAEQRYSARAVILARAPDLEAATLAGIRRAVHALDPDVPLQEPIPLPALVGRSLFPQRVAMTLIGVFGMTGLLLAGVGLYGVLAYHVGQRTREIGIRRALGATETDLVRQVVRHGLALAAAGIGVGLAAAAALTRLFASMLYGVSATDPLTFASVAALLAGIALLASYLPARRATRVDPMSALRTE
jgi:predicted permease